MDAILISLLLNLGYLAVGVMAGRTLLFWGNRSGATGAKFTLHDWLDKIDGNPIAMAIVVAGVLHALATVIAPFIRG